MSGPTSHRYRSRRLSLHYVDWGASDAPLLILLHGERDHCRTWDFIAEHLASDWHVLAPDLRGHGDSEWAMAGAYAVADYICDLAELLHELSPTPVVLIGHSLGGTIATRTAALFPSRVAKLVTIEGLGAVLTLESERAAQPFPLKLREWIEEQRRLASRSPRLYASLTEGCARLHSINPSLSPEQVIHLTRHGMRGGPDGLYRWKFDPLVQSSSAVEMSPEQVHQLWADITCQTLFVYGTRSWAASPELDGRATYFKNARLAMIEGAGHWVHHDCPGAFLEAIQSFLA